VLYVGWSNEASDSLTSHDCDATFVVGGSDADQPVQHGFTGEVVVVPDPTRIDDVVQGLMGASIDVRDFEFVCTEYEECIVPAALLAQAYGRSGLPVPTAVALRDKFVQKRHVQNAGLPVAQCEIVTKIEDLRDIEMIIPFVVKPLAGAGTRLTYAVADQESLESTARSIASSGRPGPWLVEEFMSGAELHIDGVVRDGTVRFLAVSRYLQNVINIRSGGVVGSLVLDPQANPDLYDRARELTAASLEAIGHSDGVFHLEAFQQGDRLVFSECAGRIGGGMVWETTIAKFGVDLYDEWARAVLGRPSGIAAGGHAQRRPDGRPLGWIHLPARPGRVVSIPGPSDLEKRPGVIAAQVSLKPGDTVPDSTVASHFRAARVTMTGETDQALEQALWTLAEWFREQVEVAS
jgi:L-amino acid ligase C-terminal domain 2